MLVSQLIELLEKLPPHREVFIDCSPSQADYFQFVAVDDADEISFDDENDTVVVITPFKIDEAPTEPSTYKSN